MMLPWIQFLSLQPYEETHEHSGMNQEEEAALCALHL